LRLEPVATPPKSESETIVNGNLKAADETIVSDDRLTDDEALRLLLEGDEEAEKERATLLNAPPTQATAAHAPAATPSEKPTSSDAGDILRQMRRTKK